MTSLLDKFYLICFINRFKMLRISLISRAIFNVEITFTAL